MLKENGKLAHIIGCQDRYTVLDISNDIVVLHGVTKTTKTILRKVRSLHTRRPAPYYLIIPIHNHCGMARPEM